MQISGSVGAVLAVARSGRMVMVGLCAASMLAACATTDMGPMQGPSSGFAPSPMPPSPAPAPRTFIYPNRGQTPQQQEFDRGQCYSWAVQQSGFDPVNPRVAMPPPPPAEAPQGGMFRGAAGGAALGAVGGAIGGNAGEGAAIGAGVGALFGLMRRAESMEAQQQRQQSYMQQQQSAMAGGRANYDRAFGACMTGRGYTVTS